jgi:hypothetical protein
VLANWLQRCGSIDAVSRSQELVDVSESIRRSLPEPALAR